MEDTYIIELFWSRDESAIQLVDKKYNSTCYSIAWKILMNREDSEECVHMVCGMALYTTQKTAKTGSFFRKNHKGIRN